MKQLSWEDALKLKKGDTVYVRAKLCAGREMGYAGYAYYLGHWPQGDGVNIETVSGRKVAVRFDELYKDG